MCAVGCPWEASFWIDISPIKESTVLAAPGTPYEDHMQIEATTTYHPVELTEQARQEYKVAFELSDAEIRLIVTGQAPSPFN
jgi:hypothetical protein